MTGDGPRLAAEIITWMIANHHHHQHYCPQNNRHNHYHHHTSVLWSRVVVGWLRSWRRKSSTSLFLSWVSVPFPFASSFSWAGTLQDDSEKIVWLLLHVYDVSTFSSSVWLRRLPMETCFLFYSVSHCINYVAVYLDVADGSVAFH